MCMQKHEMCMQKHEMCMLKNLKNDFIIKFVDAFEDPTEIILVTEYLHGGELFETVAFS
jgi:serine/threonine protein kinase